MHQPPGMLAAGRPLGHVGLSDLLRFRRLGKAVRIGAFGRWPKDRLRRNIETMDTAGKFANRLLCTYAMQCDTLTSLRRGGSQVVEVQDRYHDRRKPEGAPEKGNRGHALPNGRLQAAALSDSTRARAKGRAPVRKRSAGDATATVQGLLRKQGESE